jgi:4-amino-4-deoxy-L-arabinose transferase-like glycosyltransferase
LIAVKAAELRSQQSGVSHRWREALLLTGLCLLGFTLRLPYLWDIPRLTDELQEILWALSIARGEMLPLTAVDSYYGPIWSYLLALTFRLVGPSDAIPRLVAAILASAGIALTYVVCRAFVDKKSALFAALLLLTSGAHVVITAHTARSNSTTPLFLLGVVWLTHRAISVGDGRALAAAGLVFGLALQTHISVIAFVPGVALAVLIGRPRLLLSPWPVLAGLGAAVGYANMILYNLLNDFYSFNHAHHLQEGYSGGRSMDLATYASNLQALIQSLMRMLSGTIDIDDSLARYPYVIAAGLGLLILAKRGAILPLLFCLSAVIVLPYFNPRYGPILSGRYLVPLLPFCFLGIAITAGTLVDLALRQQTERVRYGVLAAVILVACTFPLVHLKWYYDDVLADGRTNGSLYALAQSADRLYRPGETVLLDEVLAQEQLTAGGTDLKAMRMLLETREIPYEVSKIGSDLWREVATEGQPVLAIMDARKRQALDRRLRVGTTGAEVQSASGSEHRYGVYRVVLRDEGNQSTP